MEQQLVELARLAQREQAVASGMLDGMQLLVYPLDGGGAIVAIGYDKDAAHRIRAEEVVRKRAENMAAFGTWLPSMFIDGSFYLTQRVERIETEGDKPVLPSSRLMAARELLT